MTEPLKKHRAKVVDKEEHVMRNISHMFVTAAVVDPKICHRSE